jgi:prolipoprotein diacylglyceryltransferase
MKLVTITSTHAHLIHVFFEWMAIAIGVQIYRWQRQHRGLPGMLERGQYAVIIGCITGAAIGNKLMFWIQVPHLWPQLLTTAYAWMAGQSIVGGLLGGLLGVELAKKIIGMKQSTGDNFVLPLIVATCIGRIGCFLAGLTDDTYGNPTQLPWGVDFGDGIPRHPTQIYDMLYVVLLGLILFRFKNKLLSQPGLMFKLYLTDYLLWRLLVDSLKPVPYDYGMGLSGIQLTCLITLFIYLPIVVKQIKTRHYSAAGEMRSFPRF